MELSKAGETVDEYWLGIPGHISNIELGAFVVMPNHLRGIIILQESPRQGRGPHARWAHNWFSINIPYFHA